MATVDFTLDELKGGVREIVRQEFAPIHTEIKELQGELRTGLADVRSELRVGLSEVRSELQEGLADVRGELQTGLAGVRRELEEGLIDVRAEIRSVKDMLTDDFIAEAGCLSRTNRRLLKLRREFDAHIREGHVSASH